jgi:ABC-2 type transport system ATP-binding protein
MSDSAIAVEHIGKRFGDVVAVDDVSFNIARGATAALLGGNGAGKTTTIAMLLGLVLPDRGRIEIFGVDMIRNRYQVLPRINFSSPYVDLPRRLTVAENLRVYGLLYGVRGLTARIRRLAEDLDISTLLRRKYGELSSGQRTRVTLAKALLNEPELILLDEPTASLDPDTADWVRAYLENYRDRAGATLLLASHNMTEVERMCDHVLMLRAGRLVDQGTPHELLARYGRHNMEEVFIDIARERHAKSR